MSDHKFMALALQEAWKVKGSTLPNPAVGAVLVRDGVVLATGATSPVGGPHAEVTAIKNARAKGIDVVGSTLYCTLEPCSHEGRTPPCTKAIVEAGITKVVVACKDQNPLVAGQGFEQLREAEVEVITGILKKACTEFYTGYFYSMVHKRPYISVKIAQSLDGCMAEAVGVRSAITGEDSHDEVQRLRGLSDAILIGGNTVRIDNPSLRAQVMIPDLSEKNESAIQIPALGDFIYQPHIYILTRQTDWSKELELFSEFYNGKVTLLTPTELEEKLDQADAVNQSTTEISPMKSKIGLLKAIEAKMTEDGIHSLWVEPGPSLAGAWLTSRLWQKFYVLTGSVEFNGGVRWAHVLQKNWEDRFDFGKLARLGGDEWQVATAKK